MDSLNEDHLLKLHSYLTKHCYDRKGNRAIRNDLLNKYVEIQSDAGVNSEKMCPYCFSFWNEGDFSMTFIPKRTPRKGSDKPVQKKWVVKCLTCFKCTSFKYLKAKHVCSRLKKKNARKPISTPSKKPSKFRRQSRDNCPGNINQKRAKNSGMNAPSKNKLRNRETRKTALNVLPDLL